MLHEFHPPGAEVWWPGVHRLHDRLQRYLITLFLWELYFLWSILKCYCYKELMNCPRQQWLIYSFEQELTPCAGYRLLRIAALFSVETSKDDKTRLSCVEFSLMWVSIRQNGCRSVCCIFVAVTLRLHAFCSYQAIGGRIVSEMTWMGH